MDKTQKKWLQNVKDLSAFREEYGHFNVHKVYGKHHKLGNWVRKVRTQYKSITNNSRNPQTTLTEQQILSLNEIGFTWDPSEEWFFHWYQRLMQYKKKYGNVHAMDDCTEFDGIGNWTNQIRKAYKSFGQRKNSKNLLTKDRIKLLVEVGFEWSVSEAKWMRKYESLVSFRKTFDTCSVSKQYDHRLYNFVNIQRRDYRIRFGKSNANNGRGISDKRIKLLENINFVFDVKKDRYLMGKAGCRGE